MGVIQCGECGESVDDAKAFCPGCGGSLVTEEDRTDTSSFDQHDSTVQFGQTMFNQMLSEMGLKGTKQADEPEKPAETATETPVAVQPRVTPPPPVVLDTPPQVSVKPPVEAKPRQPATGRVEPPRKKRVAMIAPIETGSSPKITVAPVEGKKAKSSSTKWIILGLSILALLGIVVIAAAIAIYFYWFRLR